MSRTFQGCPTLRFVFSLSPAGRGLARAADCVALLANILDISCEVRLAAQRSV